MRHSSIPWNPLLRNTKSAVESSSSRSILGSQSCHLSLGSKTRSLASRALRNAAVVDEVVADGVGDDVGVQRVFLSLGDGRVDWEEGSLGGFATWSAKLEGHGWVASTELGSCGSARNGRGSCCRRGEECEEKCLGLHLEVGGKVRVIGLAGDN